MPPKFATALAWEQANLMMQPAFIRVLDNLRKWVERLEPWHATYETVACFPPGTSEEDQVQVQALHTALESANPTEAIALQQQLSQLPQPYAGYELCLTQGDRQVRIDLWELCYQVCFTQYIYHPDHPLGEAQMVEVDLSLVNAQNELDWERLEEKTQRVLERVFNQLSL
jgi:hypothetical protein